MSEKILYVCRIIVFVGLASIYADATVQCKVDKDKQPLNVLEGLNKFAFNVFKEIIKEKSNKNIFISPLSISYALSMAYNGASGETKKAFEKTLLPNQQWCESEDVRGKVNKSFSDLMATLTKKDSNVTLTIANSLWAKKGVEFKEDFLAKNKEHYKATIESLNFDNDAIKTINDWVKNNTNGKIEKIIETFSPGDIIIILNAIYFKGIWKYKFDKKNTKEDNFNLLDGSKKKVEFMNIDFKGEKVGYYGNNDFQLVEVLYSNEYRMYIFLPSVNSSLEKFYANLTYENVKKWLSELHAMKGHLSIPKFKLEYEEELSEILKKLGMEVAFSPKADFSNMCKISKDLNVNIGIGKVKHKTFVEVNEEGTEAAAVTSVMLLRSYVEEFNFIVNRPFFFLIMNKKDGVILFMGSVVDL